MMETVEIVDTNVILRFLVGDEKTQLRRASEIFRQAERGERQLLIKVLVVAEACFVLESFYKNSRVEIAQKMQVFLSQKWLKVEDRREVLSLWDDYVSGLHFVDSFLLAWVRVNKGGVVSFDRELRGRI